MQRHPVTTDLEKTLAAQAAENAALRAQIQKLGLVIVALEEELRLERARRYAPRSEKAKERIFNEAEQAAAEAGQGSDGGDDGGADAIKAPVVPDTNLPAGEKPEPQKRGRKPLPAGIPRTRVEYDLPEDQKSCPCCSHAMHRMGENLTEQLHIEIKATVLQNVRFKYACRHCERNEISTPVVIAPMPAQPLPGSVATASTLAFVLASKFVDGMPLYRLSQSFERAHVSISRGTLGNWVIGSSDLHLERIYEGLKIRLRGQDLIHGDETWVQVLKEKGRHAQSKSYMWGYRSGADSPEPIVLFEYQPGRGQIYPQTFLAGYSGLLMTDGYDAWRTLEGAAHLGCMAHARRKFTDAIKGRKKPGGPALEALKFFEALYKVEALARETLPEGETREQYTLRLRQQHSVPVLETFREWLDEMAEQVLPKSYTGEAIAYARNQWEYLTRYASDGRAPIDNNLLERDIRVFVTGRKNWLFSDTTAGAKASAIIYSLMLTCRACGIDPQAWLAHVLAELPLRGPDDNIDDLFPFNFPGKNTAPVENST